MKIAHVALWTHHPETQQQFWREWFNAKSNALYQSRNRPGFASYFMRLEQGATIELMTLPDLAAGQPGREVTGWAHIAISVGNEQQVERLAARAAEAGILVAAPRRTGDGFYEAIIRDPDGNLIELVAE
ncbi:VOC family protein [Pantoea sp. GD03673]|uniref:VOC family protein n=1 Tax=Pantoea sp. GD03673 TaxID=2975364 RepID=UPI00244A35A1|nr:VOC family protein [Pantoea sp. GD03673]MDH2066965.1 VOC family protein [Pantoea sp. GD03673]